MRAVLILSVVALTSMASAASAALAVYDDFNDNTWDNAKWTRTSTSLVTETGGTLQVNGSGGTQQALSVQTFLPDPSFARFEFVEKYQGGNDELMGLYNSGGFRFRTDQNANFWIEAGPTFEDSLLPYAATNGTLIRYRIDWSPTSTIMAIDKGDDGIWEFTKAYAHSITGPLPFAFRDQVNASVLQIDAVYLPEPAALGLLALSSLIMFRRSRV